MDPRLLASRCAVTMDAADTSIIWRVSLLVRGADSVTVYWMNAWRVYAASASSASLLWSPTITLAAVNFGSAAAGKRSLAPSQWGLIFRRRAIAQLKS